MIKLFPSFYAVFNQNNISLVTYHNISFSTTFIDLCRQPFPGIIKNNDGINKTAGKKLRQYFVYHLRQIVNVAAHLLTPNRKINRDSNIMQGKPLMTLFNESISVTWGLNEQCQRGRSPTSIFTCVMRHLH